MTTEQHYVPRHAAQERIFLSAPDMSDSEREALLDAFDSNWIAPVGPAIDKLEEQLCELTNREAAVAVTSGTAALHLGLQVLGVQPGDVVVVPSLTFVASANAVRYLGAEPVFVDCDPATGNIDPNLLEICLRGLANSHRRPAAVMTVDLYGSCANYTQIEAICSTYGVPIIEDSAESIGARHGGRPAGSFGTLSVFSFNGNKLVTSGGGGALVGPQNLIERAHFLASQARSNALHFEHEEVGYAYRLSNLLASIASAQLDRLPEMMSRTRAINLRYRETLSLIAGAELIDIDREGTGNGWLSVVQLDQRCHGSAHEICELLAADGIEARPAWKPMHMQTLYGDSVMIGGSAAEDHFATGLCLPSGSSMTSEQQERVIARLMAALSATLRPDAQALTITLPESNAPHEPAQSKPAHARANLQLTNVASAQPAGIEIPQPALADPSVTIHQASRADHNATPTEIRLPAPTPTVSQAHTQPQQGTQPEPGMQPEWPKFKLPAPQPVIDLNPPLDLNETLDLNNAESPRRAPLPETPRRR